MDRGRQGIEDYHLMTEVEQAIAGVGADEAGSPGDQDLH
jgi:hypothetical protein